MLIIFDLDGTIIINSKFYKEVYSKTLNEVVEEERGQHGLSVLNYCRKNYDDRGELSLFSLNIPFDKWADKLIDAPLNLIVPQPALVKRIQMLNAKKVIYTASPVEMAYRLLEKLGFCPKQDFDCIIGWQNPETSPLKWTCSSFVFEAILEKFQCKSNYAYSVGDDWEMDLKPAKSIGIKTVGIRKQAGSPDIWFSTLEEFVIFMQQEKEKGDKNVYTGKSRANKHKAL